MSGTTFTIEDYKIGIKYLKDNNFYEQFKKYELSEDDIREKQIYCLDEFIIFPFTEKNISKNVDFIFDLEKVIRTGSGYGMSKYIYELLLYIKY